MRHFFAIFISVLLLLSGTVKAQCGLSHNNKYEYRAVWLTAIENLDWPGQIAKDAAGVERQKAGLVAILDSLKSLHVNTVLLQVRVRGDVIYPSEIEPFSYVFTGTAGKSPGYDPLAFAVSECHKRGMQLHAWMVTLPLGKDAHVRKQGKLALPQRRRSLCTHYKGQWYMEPGNPATEEYIVELVREVVSKYDVDGIHLDYVRYPDRTNGYPDAALYRKHGGGLSLADWRRSNITSIARAVYKSVKELKPWVRVSCAPLGKYDDLARYSSLGWNAYDAVFQDAQGWMREGIMDILFPMLYFNGNNFYPFVRDWQENACGRHIVPGIGIYRLLPEYGGWPRREIERQLRTSRGAGTAGSIMFRTAHLTGNAGGALDVYSSVYRTPALVPPMEWAGGSAPSAPEGVRIERSGKGIAVSWNAVKGKVGEPAIRYNVYFSQDGSVDTGKAESLIAWSLAGTSFEWECSAARAVSVAVTAVDAYGRESAPALVSDGCGRYFANEITLPEAAMRGMRIEVTDMYGRCIYRGKYRSRIGVRGVPSGLYFLRMYDRRSAFVQGFDFRK